jgi:hypothetical protein
MKLGALEAADGIALKLTPRRPRNWTRLVEEWGRLVKEVEAGYQLTIYDYHNDLDVRGTIEDVLQQLKPDDRRTVKHDVDVLDRRFVAATREGQEVIATYDRGFWARRVPTKLVGELAEDLGG